MLDITHLGLDAAGIPLRNRLVSGLSISPLTNLTQLTEIKDRHRICLHRLWNGRQSDLVQAPALGWLYEPPQ